MSMFLLIDMLIISQIAHSVKHKFTQMRKKCAKIARFEQKNDFFIKDCTPTCIIGFYMI